MLRRVAGYAVGMYLLFVRWPTLDLQHQAARHEHTSVAAKACRFVTGIDDERLVVEHAPATGESSKNPRSPTRTCAPLITCSRQPSPGPHQGQG